MPSFVLVRPILLLGQHGNALLATFLLRSNKTHDAIDSDGVAPLVEALDRDCSLAGFYGGAMHFDSLIFVFSDLAQDPCPNRPAWEEWPAVLAAAALRRGKKIQTLRARSAHYRHENP